MTPPRVSIILPSIHLDACRSALENIEETTRGLHEVVLVSPLDLGHVVGGSKALYRLLNQDRLRFKNVGDADGPIKTQALGVKHVTGEFVVAHSDDFRYEPGWDDSLVEEYQAREAMWHDRGVPDPLLVMGLRFDLIGTVFGIYYANFPCVRRSLIDRLGWYDPAYDRGFGDCDLSLRAWDMGGTVEFTRRRVLRATEDDKRKGARLSGATDADLFVARWREKVGDSWAVATMDDYNVNLAPDDRILEARTFMVNSPKAFAAFRSMAAPRLLRQGPAANVVSYGGRFWVIPRSIAAVNLEREEDRARPELLVFDDLVEACWYLDPQ